MPQEPNRTARIEARIAPEALVVVKRAAEIQGRGLSAFLVEDQRAIADTILSPPPLTPAMERAIRRHRQVITASR